MQTVARDLADAVQVQECGWFGAVPADWSVKPLKIIASLNDEVLAEDTDSDEEIQYVDIGSVNSRGEIETISTMYFGQAPSRARRRVRHGDTIVSTVRTYLRAIARVVDPAPNLIVSTGFAVIRPRGAEPFYEVTEIDAPTDPNQIYMLRTRLDQFQYYWWQEVEGFAEVFYRPKQQQAATDQARLHAFVDPAVSRFKDEPDEERREAFRSLLVGYLRMYALLSQMVDYLGPGYEKLYSFGRLLRTKLPRREREGELELDGDVALAYYRLSQTTEGDRSLQPGDREPVTGAAEVGTSRPKDDQRSPLSEIISTINDRFGTDWKPEDRLLFDQVVEDLAQDDELGEQARANDLDNFKHVFDPKALDAFIHRMERNSGIASQVLNNREMLAAVMAAMMREVYDRARDA